MLILTLPHVSSAARLRSLYVQEPLCHRGKEPLRTPSLQNWVGENKQAGFAEVFWKFNPVYPLEKNIVKTSRLKFVVFVLGRS